MLRNPRDVLEKQAEGPTTRDANTRGERDITHEAPIKGDGESTAKPQKIDPEDYQQVSSESKRVPTIWSINFELRPLLGGE